MIFAKAGKAIAKANTRAARFETVYNQLKLAGNRAINKGKRKRIPIDPNQRFTSVDLVVEAIRKLEQEQAKIVHKNAGDAAEIASKIAAAQTLENMCFEWALQSE